MSIAAALFCLAFLRLIGALDRRYEVPLALCLTIVAFVLSFTRWETGTDWDTYVNMYYGTTSITGARDQNWWGPGYSYIAVALNSWRASYSTFLFCIATILFVTKFHVLTKSCAAPLVAIFILFCGDFYDVYFVRQSVAVVFFWAFTYYYYERKYALAILAALLAFLFHYSSVVPIGLVILVANLHWRRILILAPLMTGAAYFLLTHANINDLLSATDVGTYLGNGFVEEKASALSTTAREYIKIAFWVIVVGASYVFFLKRGNSDESSRRSAFFVKCAFAIIAVTLVLLPVSEIFARLSEFSLPLFAVSLSDYRFRLHRITVGGLAYLVAISLLFVELGFLYSAYPDKFYPIKTIFG